MISGRAMLGTDGTEPVMNSTGYKRITNLCFAIAVACVLLFDRFPAIHWLTGTLLIASGIVAMTVHFYVQWRPTSAAVDRKFIAREAKVPQASVAHLEASISSGSAEAGWVGTTVELPKIPRGGSKAYSYEPVLNAGIIVEVCEKLAAATTDFEVTLTGEGNLRIRPIREKRQLRAFEDLDVKPHATKGGLLTSNLIH